MNASLGKGMLLLRDGDSGDFCANGRGYIFGKAAPSTADLQDMIIGLDIGKLGKALIFVDLGLREIIIIIFEDCG